MYTGVPTKQSHPCPGSPEGPSLRVGVNKECCEEAQESSVSCFRSLPFLRELFCVVPRSPSCAGVGGPTEPLLFIARCCEGAEEPELGVASVTQETAPTGPHSARPRDSPSLPLCPTPPLPTCTAVPGHRLECPQQPRGAFPFRLRGVRGVQA